MTAEPLFEPDGPGPASTPAPKPDIVLSARVPAELRRDFAELAQAAGRPVSDYVRAALQAYADLRLARDTEAAAGLRALARLGRPRKLADEPGRNELGPFARASSTSRAAALDNYPRSGTQRARVLDAVIRRTGAGYPVGLTREELARTLGLSDNTIRPRVRELIDGGFIETHPDLTRPTATGNAGEVLIATDKAVNGPGAT